MATPEIQAATIEFAEKQNSRPGVWDNMSDSQRSKVADGIFYNRVQPKLGAIGDAAIELARTEFRDTILNPQILGKIQQDVELQTQTPFQTYLNETGNQLALDATDLPANYNNPANAVAGFAGRFTGGLAQDLGAGAGGAAIGGLFGGIPGAALGYGIGQFGSGAAQGFTGAIDRFQDAGRPLGMREYLAATGEGLGYGVLNVIPGVGQADGFIRQVLKNAGLQAAGTAGVDATSQYISDGQVDVNRLGMAAAVGGGGGVAGTIAGRSMQSAKRFNQNFASLQHSIQSMVQPQAAPVGLGGIPPMGDGAIPAGAVIDVPASTSTMATIPEGQGAGTTVSSAPETPLDRNRAMLNQALDAVEQSGNINSLNTKTSSDGVSTSLADTIYSLSESEPGAYDDIVDRMDTLLYGTSEQNSNLASKIVELTRGGRDNEADRLTRNLPKQQKRRVNELVRSGNFLDKPDIEQLGAKYNQLMNQGRSGDARNMLKPYTTKEKNLIKQEHQFLKERQKEQAEVRKRQNEEAARKEYAKKRSEEETEKIKQKLEKKRLDMAYSRSFDELDGITTEYIASIDGEGKKVAKVELASMVSELDLTRRDKAYIEQKAKDVLDRRKVKAKSSSEKEAAIIKAQKQEVSAEAQSVMGLISRYQDDANAAEVLNELGYKINRVDDGYGRDSMRGVLMGGKLGTVKFEPGDTLQKFSERIKAKGGDLDNMLANRLAKNAQESGQTPYEIMKGRLDEVDEAIEFENTGRLDAGEGRTDLDEIQARQGDLALQRRQAQEDALYDEIEEVKQQLSDLLDRADTPEKAVMAINDIDELFEKNPNIANEYLFSSIQEKYEKAIESAQSKLEMENIIDEAIKSKRLVNFEGAQFQHSGRTLKQSLDGEAFSSGKTLDSAPNETIIERDVIVDNTGKAWPIVRTLDEKGQQRTRYLHGSPLGSKISKVVPTNKFSPYSLNKSDAGTFIEGPDGVVARLKTEEARLTSDLRQDLGEIEKLSADLARIANAGDTNAIPADEFVTIVRKAEQYGLDAEVREIFNKMDQPQRAKLHKDVFGEPC